MRPAGRHCAKLQQVERHMRQWVKRFSGDDSGATAVEVVIWVPVFMLVLAFILDTTLSLVAHSLMWDVARDTVRQLSLGILNQDAAVSHARSAAYLMGAVPTVTASDAGPEVWVQIDMPINRVTLFDFIGIAGSEEITARAVMIKEPV
jgi:hypothetical protein